MFENPPLLHFPDAYYKAVCENARSLSCATCNPKCKGTVLLFGHITFWFSSISALSSEETTVFVMALQK